jgi:hypothetical protein
VPDVLLSASKHTDDNFLLSHNIYKSRDTAKQLIVKIIVRLAVSLQVYIENYSLFSIYYFLLS